MWIGIASVLVAAAVVYFSVWSSGTRGPAPEQESAAPSPPAAAAPVASEPPPAGRESATPEPGRPGEPAAAADSRAGAPAGDVDRLSVALSAMRPVWVSATVDGQKAVGRLLQAGERQTFDVRREIVLTTGDAAAVRLVVNGEAIRPLGGAGEVVTTRLNLANYKQYLQKP